MISLRYLIIDYFPGVLDLSPMFVQLSPNIFFEECFVSVKGYCIYFIAFWKIRGKEIFSIFVKELDDKSINSNHFGFRTLNFSDFRIVWYVVYKRFATNSAPQVSFSPSFTGL